MAGENQGAGAIRLDSFYNSIVNGYNNVQKTIANRQQEELKRLEKEQISLADAYSKVNTKGVQAVDIPEVSKITQKLYDTYYNASKSNSLEAKMQARLEIQRSLDGLSQFVELSKKRGVDYDNLIKSSTDPRNIGLYNEEAINRIKSLANIPTSKLNPNELNINNFMSADTSYVPKTIQSTIDNLFKNTPSSIRLGKNVNIAGKSGVEQFQEQEIMQASAMDSLSSVYNNDIKFKNTVDVLASQQGITPQQVILNTLSTTPLKRSKQIATQFAYKPTSSGSSNSAENTYTQRQRDNEGLLNLDIDALNEVKATLLPEAKVDFAEIRNRKDGTIKNMIRFEIPAKDNRTLPTVEFVDISEPNAYARVNTLLNSATGEKVSSSKARTVKGKSFGEEFKPKTTAPKKQTVKLSKFSNVLDTD